MTPSNPGAFDEVVVSQPSFFEGLGSLLTEERLDDWKAWLRAKVVHAAAPYLTDDLVQETLLAIHSRRATYEPDRPFTVWLHAIARYRLIDHFRRSGRRPTVPIDDVDEAAFASDSDESAATNLDLDRLLATVPPETRKMIRQVKIEGQAIADVAAETGRTPTAVKVGIHRGLRRITARLRGGEGGS